MPHICTAGGHLITIEVLWGSATQWVYSGFSYTVGALDCATQWAYLSAATQWASADGAWSAKGARCAGPVGAVALPARSGRAADAAAGVRQEAARHLPGAPLPCRALLPAVPAWGCFNVCVVCTSPPRAHMSSICLENKRSSSVGFKVPAFPPGLSISTGLQYAALMP